MANSQGDRESLFTASRKILTPLVVGNLGVADEKACVDACAVKSNCKSAMFSASEKKCWLGVGLTFCSLFRKHAFIVFYLVESKEGR